MVQCGPGLTRNPGSSSDHPGLMSHESCDRCYPDANAAVDFQEEWALDHIECLISPKRATTAVSDTTHLKGNPRNQDDDITALTKLLDFDLNNRK